MPQLVCITVQLFCVWDCSEMPLGSTEKEVNTIPDCMAFCVDTKSSPVYWLGRMAMAPHGNIHWSRPPVLYIDRVSLLNYNPTVLSPERFLPSQWVPVLANHFSYARLHCTKVWHMQNLYDISLRKQPTFQDANTGFKSPGNDVWETSAEIPYWWRVTTQIWVAVLLIGRATLEICFNRSEALPRSG